MKPEEKARQNIDQLLEKAGRKVQDYREINLGASVGVAVREFPLKSGTADYLLFVDRKPVGVVEVFFGASFWCHSFWCQASVIRYFICLVK
jgi:type I restriction enzyme R subunit